MFGQELGHILERAGEAMGELLPILADLAMRVGTVVVELVRQTGVTDILKGLG